MIKIKPNQVGVGPVLGVGVCLAIGNSMVNVGAGLAIGIALGIAFGAKMQKKKIQANMTSGGCGAAC